jgi:anti-sigma factor RsiW
VYVVVCVGWYATSPDGADCFAVSVPDVMLLSTVSAVIQFKLAASPQLIWLGVAARLPVTGATATVALAVPALNRGNEPISPPLTQGLTF